MKVPMEEFKMKNTGIFDSYDASWNVLKFDNFQMLQPFNIFSSQRFRDFIYTTMTMSGISKLDFERDIRAACQAAYMSKCEYEFVVSNWPSEIVKQKVSIYSQILANWDHFINYMWDLHNKIIKDLTFC